MIPAAPRDLSNPAAGQFGMVEATGVTFSTKCWQRDYRRVLGGAAAEQTARCQHDFAARVIWVNNVDDREAVAYEAGFAQSRGDGQVRFVEDVADVILAHFKVTREDLGRGYVYSICEMAEILFCETPYLLHHAGDVALAAPAKWVDRAVAILEGGDPRVAVVNPVWNGRIEEARYEAVEEREDHFLSFGFSDQCYLVRVADFRGDILRETHPAGARYPTYGGELFEKRVDAWMRNHGRLRATLKNVAYTHPWRG